MLHLRDAGLLKLNALTVSGETLGKMLDWWEGSSERRAACARDFSERDGVDRRRRDHGSRRSATARPDIHRLLPAREILRPKVR